MKKNIFAFAVKLALFAFATTLFISSAMAATCSPAYERRGAVLRNGQTANGTLFSVTTREVTGVGAIHTHGQIFDTQNISGQINVEMPQDYTAFYHYLDHGGFRHASEVGRTPYVYWNGGTGNTGWCRTVNPPDGSPTQVYIYMPRDLTLNFRAGTSPIPNAEFITTLTHRGSNTGKIQKLHQTNASGNFLLCPPVGTHGSVSAGGAFATIPNFPTSSDGYLPINGTMGVALISGGFQYDFTITRSEVDSGGSKILSVPAATSIYVEKMGTALANTTIGIFVSTSQGWQIVNPFEVTTNASGIATFYIPTAIASSLGQVAIGITENGSTKLYGYYDLSSPASVNIFHTVEDRPNLLLPAESASISAPITFQWEDLSSQNPNHGFYWLSVYQDGDLFDEGGLYSTSISGIVYPEGDYQWRVEAYDASGRMYAISEVRNFSVVGSGSGSTRSMSSKGIDPAASISKQLADESSALKDTKAGGKMNQLIRINADESIRDNDSAEKMINNESNMDRVNTDIVQELSKPTESELLEIQQRDMVGNTKCVTCP